MLGSPRSWRRLLWGMLKQTQMRLRQHERQEEEGHTCLKHEEHASSSGRTLKTNVSNSHALHEKAKQASKLGDKLHMTKTNDWDVLGWRRLRWSLDAGHVLVSVNLHRAILSHREGRKRISTVYKWARGNEEETDVLREQEVSTMIRSNKKTKNRREAYTECSALEWDWKASCPCVQARYTDCLKEKR